MLKKSKEKPVITDSNKMEAKVLGVNFDFQSLPERNK